MKVLCGIDLNGKTFSYSSPKRFCSDSVVGKKSCSSFEFQSSLVRCACFPWHNLAPNIDTYKTTQLSASSKVEKEGTFYKMLLM